MPRLLALDLAVAGLFVLAVASWLWAPNPLATSYKLLLLATVIAAYACGRYLEPSITETWLLYASIAVAVGSIVLQLIFGPSVVGGFGNTNFAA
jgi:hypothetical protein